jgi:multidrug efflux pump subunit AcrB
MKTPFYISFVASGLSLVLSVVVLFVGRGNQRLNADSLRLQEELQKAQEYINSHNRIGSGPPVLLRDVATASLKDEKIRALLKKHGYTVATPTPAPGLPE